MNTNGIVDIINALPISKLISTVSAGIGKLYEPTHIKRIAKAKAEEIKLISGAMEECSVIPTQYNDGSLTLNNTDWDDFVRRTQGRMAFQELQKQNNIECVVANAYNILEKEQTCSEDAVEQGWINRFFDSVADISDEDLQHLWGKILAGEIMSPKTYSLRTLETLKSVSQSEAQIFRMICKYTLVHKNTFNLPTNSNLFADTPIDYADIMILGEAGLINFQNVSYTIYLPRNENTIIEVGGSRLSINNVSAKPMSLLCEVYSLTTAGMEIFDIVHSCKDNEGQNDDFVQAYAFAWLVEMMKINDIGEERYSISKDEELISVHIK